MDNSTQSLEIGSAQSGATNPPAHTRATLVAEICARITEGEAITKVCGPNRDPHMPEWSTFYRWMVDDADIKRQYDLAMQARVIKLVDSTFAIADDGQNDWMAKNDPNNPGYVMNGEAVQRSKLRIGNIQWFAERIGRRLFGQSVALTGHDDMPPVKTTNVNLTPEQAYRTLLTGGTPDPDDGSEFV